MMLTMIADSNPATAATIAHFTLMFILHPPFAGLMSHGDRFPDSFGSLDNRKYFSYNGSVLQDGKELIQ